MAERRNRLKELLVACTTIGALGVAGCSSAAMAEAPKTTQIPPSPDTPEPSDTAEPAQTQTPDVLAPTDSDMLLDPSRVRDMTPEERLDAIRIPKEALTDTDTIGQRYYDTVASILNCGSDPKEYDEWMQQATSGLYSDHVLQKYYLPLLAHLHGVTPDELRHSNPKLRNMAVRQMLTLDLAQYPESGVQPAHFSYIVSDTAQPLGNKYDYSLAMNVVSSDGITPAMAEVLSTYGNAGEVNVISNEPTAVRITLRWDEKHKTVTGVPSANFYPDSLDN